MHNKLKNAASCLLTIGALGYISNKFIDINHAAADTIFFTALVIGLFGTSLFNFMEQRAKSKGKGKRAASIASTVYLIFIVIICAWAILEKLGIIRY